MDNLSENFEPTEQMVARQQEAESRAQRLLTSDQTEHDGDIVTEEFSVSEAISSL